MIGKHVEVNEEGTNLMVICPKPVIVATVIGQQTWSESLSSIGSKWWLLCGSVWREDWGGLGSCLEDKFGKWMSKWSSLLQYRNKGGGDILPKSYYDLLILGLSINSNMISTSVTKPRYCSRSYNSPQILNINIEGQGSPSLPKRRLTILDSL